MDPHRSERLAEALREELEEIINYELTDPRIGEVAVIEVALSPDHRKAHVRLHPTDDIHEDETFAALEHAKGYLRRQLTERLAIYRIPELYFLVDAAPGLRRKAPQLLRRIRKGRPRQDAPPAPAGDKKSPPQ